MSISDPSKKVNRAGLWPNTNKETANQPDLRGQGFVKCPHCGGITDFWVALWHATERTGNQPHHSLSFQPNAEQIKANQLANAIASIGQAQQQGGGQQGGGFGGQANTGSNSGFGSQGGGSQQGGGFGDDIPF